MMAFPSRPSNQKWGAYLAKTMQNPWKTRSASIFCLLLILAAICRPIEAEEPPSGEGHELEELGVNRYTAPSIAQVFKQLDELKPFPYDELKRELPQTSGASREQKALMFGQLIADGFLLVEAERKNLVDDFGRVLMQQARALGVGDRVMRHSASLTELGRRGEWPRMRQELITTQTDVEQAMMDLRDEKMAHLISLGGWLRGLEIAASAVEREYLGRYDDKKTPGHAKLLGQPEVANYFAEELKTLPPATAHAALFQRLGSGIEKLRPLLGQVAKLPLPLAPKLHEIVAIRTDASELNNAILRGE
jgi:hypothetical protein